MITVIKNNHTGREVWRYTGEPLECGTTWIRLEAFFNAPDRITEYHTFHHGDRFVELFYTDRWYSIFEMHDVQDDRLVGWYCNIARPALITFDRIEADDLALDLFVRPDGSMIVLDEDEFAVLPIPDHDRDEALAALVELQTMVTQHQPPFTAAPN
jgi:hypothetical protein